jgi:hypothetical protein
MTFFSAAAAGPVSAAAKSRAAIAMRIIVIDLSQSGRSPSLGKPNAQFGRTIPWRA